VSRVVRLSALAYKARDVQRAKVRKFRATQCEC